jgi:hypothetical protein
MARAMVRVSDKAFGGLHYDWTVPVSGSRVYQGRRLAAVAPVPPGLRFRRCFGRRSAAGVVLAITPSALVWWPTAARISAGSRAGQGRARSSGRSPSPCPRGAPVRDPRCRGRKAPSACTRPVMQWPLSSRWASDCSPRRLEWAIMPPAPIGPRKSRRGNQADLLALSAGLIVVAISSGCRSDCRGACGMGGGR